MRLLLLVLLGCSAALSSCGSRIPVAPSAPAAAPTPRVQRPAPLPETGEPAKRTGHHPELFDEFDPLYPAATPTPTATPTPGFVEETPGSADSMPADFTAPPSGSLDALIASASAPNVAAALRLVEQGRREIDAGLSEAALDTLERAVAIDPASAQGYYFLAVAYYEQGNYSQAIGFANRAGVLASSANADWAGRAYTLQGTIFEKVGRYPDARDAYARALDFDPGNVRARVGLNRLGGDVGDPTEPGTP